MSKKLAPISRQQSATWNGSNTVYIIQEGSETPQQAAIRKSNNNNVLVINTLVPSRIITNPNIDSNTTPITPGPSALPLVGGYGEGTTSELFAYAPFVPGVNQFSSWPYGGMQRQYLDNGIIRAGFAKGMGGTLDYLSEVGKPNLLNNNRQDVTSVYEGDQMPDKGRQAGPAVYGTPYTYTEAGQTTTGIGWNGVVGGSIFQDHSLILHYERRFVQGYGDVLCFKTQPQQWEMNNILAKCYIYSFYWLNGNALNFYYILENNRTDNQMEFDGRGQELPFAYLTASHYRYFVYTGNEPGTGGALTQINKPQPVEGGGFNNQNDTGEYNSTENWIGGVNTDNQGLFIVTPYNSRFNGKQFQSWYGDENTNASAYINAVATIPFDNPGKSQSFKGSMYVGDLNSFRTWYNNSNLTTSPFSFDFPVNKTAGWYGSAKFNSSNRYEFNIGKKNDGSPNRSFVSPWRTWNTQEVPIIYIKAKISGINELNISWVRPNETPSQSANNNKVIPVIGDGLERTYAVNMTGVTNWSGLFCQLKLNNPYNYTTNTYPNVPDNAYIIPTYIGKTNPDASNI